MHKLKITFVACTIMLWAAFCQGQTTFTKKVQIHFATGKYVLTGEHKKAILKLLDSIPKTDTGMQVEIHRIAVNGHTDNEGDSATNLLVSEKRADAVVQYLVEKGMDQTVVKKNYFGETKPIVSNKDSHTKQINRRVDIEVTYVVTTNAELMAAASRPDRCLHDTLIKMHDGTLVKMSICDYERIGGDFQVNTVLNGDAVRQSGLNTMGDDGTPLMSGGMFTIRFKNDSCLKKPLTIRVPVDTCIHEPKKMLKYVYNYNKGRWTRTRVHVHVVKVKGQQFYEFTVQCPGKINIDYPRYFVSSDLRQFFTKDGLRLVHLGISNDCPCSMLDARILSSGRKAYGWISANEQEPYVSAKAVDSKGDTLTMSFKPLSTLLTKGRRQVTKRFLWIIPIHKSIYYDRYCIRRSDFDAPSTAMK